MGKHVIDFILKLVPLIIATVIAAGAAWMTQGWRYDTEIESIQRAHADTMAEISRVAAQQLQTQMDRHKKQSKEITLLDLRHYQELQDAQQNSVRLSADLAASHQRLSVRVQRCSSSHLPATTSPPAWMMEPSEPNYTRRMQRLLQPSPQTPIVAPGS